jgi:hypothetical protein
MISPSSGHSIPITRLGQLAAGARASATFPRNSLTFFSRWEKRRGALSPRRGSMHSTLSYNASVCSRGFPNENGCVFHPCVNGAGGRQAA